MHFYNEIEFDYRNSINDSIQRLKELDSESVYNECKFESNMWVIEYETLTRLIIFDFSPISNILESLNNGEILPIVKCWLAGMLDTYQLPTIKTYLIGLEGFFSIIKTKPNLDFDSFIDVLSDNSSTSKSIICKATLNFNDYNSEIINKETVRILYEINETIDKNYFVREIPPTKDILSFSKVLHHYFSSELSEEEYLKYSPIYFWWKITNIIPMRPTEFCMLKRDCIFQEKDSYYLKINRIKARKNSRINIQALKNVSIPRELYEEIEKYIVKTNNFNKSKTLINYQSFSNNRKKFRLDIFSINVLRGLLKNFYKEIFFGKYNFSLNGESGDTNNLEISKMLSLGDTRHLAFINLKRQGYHPVEIARLGGHTRLISQQHYFNHIENFVDLEILELMTNTRLYEYGADLSKVINLDFVNEKIIKPVQSEFKMKLKIGYCTDSLMRCRVDSCFQCEYWRISEEEFLEKQAAIEKIVKEKTDELRIVCKKLSELYRTIYQNLRSEEYYSENNMRIKNELNTAARNIDKAIYNYVDVIKIAERIHNHEPKG